MGGFDAIATSLREEVAAFYAGSERGSNALTAATLETNSGFVERRTRPLMELYESRAGSGIAGADVLDVGCGFGAMSVWFAAQGARVKAVDPKRARLAVGRSVAATHGLDANFSVGRAERLDQPDASFDLVVMNNSLCYLVEQEARAVALGEALRVLRPGGWILIRNPNRAHPIDQYSGLPLLPLLPARLATRAAARLGRERSLVTLRTPWGARKELLKAGFRQVRQEPSGPGPRRTYLKWVARYQHLSGQRPPTPPGPAG
jgi:ubiquinone/menaquinone biosynthesis C-methylase UbiE